MSPSYGRATSHFKLRKGNCRSASFDTYQYLALSFSCLDLALISRRIPAASSAFSVQRQQPTRWRRFCFPRSTGLITALVFVAAY